MEPPPPRRLRMLFIHHSCGGRLLAAVGPGEGSNCIYQTHPSGGGLRALLQRNSYEVHEASYGSIIGHNTDIFDWLPKFRSQMDQIIHCDTQDRPYANGVRNEIVVFKSCFPNNQFRARGTPPGNPGGLELTVWNAIATYTALLEEFKKQANTLFVCMTTPPLAPKTRAEPPWKSMAKKVLGRSTSPTRSAPLARQFNSWLSSTEGWLKNYPLRNVVVFDLYDLFTGFGQSDLCMYPTAGGYDSHPNREGNEKAAEAFAPFLNWAVDRWSKLGILNAA
jgi:hypothetical protein